MGFPVRRIESHSVTGIQRALQAWFHGSQIAMESDDPAALWAAIRPRLVASVEEWKNLPAPPAGAIRFAEQDIARLDNLYGTGS